MIFREFTDKDISQMVKIWNEVVEEGIAFPQEDFLDERSGKEFYARHLYERLGFIQLGTIPGGFRMKDGQYENICPYYHLL